MTKTDPIDRAVGKVLSQLGGIDCPQGHPIDCVFPMPDAKDAEFVDKSPIFLTSDSVHLVHEPEVCDETVNVSIDKDRILRDELPEPAARWDGGWHGTADSRLAYLRAHKGLWAFTRTCIRKTAVFFVPKKDGNLRKILACCNFNDACREPPHTRLPGTWQIQKVRFRKKRFYTAESDVSAFYSRIKSPDWIKHFLCLDEVKIGDLFDLAPGETFTCPYTGESFGPDDEAYPAWPRLPMGWSWSVALATDKASELMQKANVKTQSLNIPKDAALRSSENYSGAYIDNLFTLGEDYQNVLTVQRAIDQEFEQAGLPLSEQSEPMLQKKLLGVLLGNGSVSTPETFLAECMALSQKKKCSFWEFDKVMGKAAWLMPLKRRFFALLFKAYKLLAFWRKKDCKKLKKIRLSNAVRAEFFAVAVLGRWLATELKADPAPRMYACDASQMGWAIVDQPTGSGFINDTGLAEDPFETIVLRSRPWRLRKRRRFKRRLDHILSGEICAFRQTVNIASRENAGRDIIIYTDNSNIYYSVKKGRSSVYRLNTLCQHILVAEITYDVRIHVRWCGTKSQPADIYTRDKLPS